MQDLTTRRVFLAKGLTMLAAGATVPTFLNRTAFAVGRPFDQLLTGQDSGVDGKILVVVQLSGGNDGLNTVVPFADDTYYRVRPNVGVRSDQVLRLNDHIGLNPQLAPLKELYDDGRMTLVQGVGYPNPDRSHFRSMDIWHTANPEEEAITSGWLGRYFDAQCCGEDPGDPSDDTTPDPHVGIALGDSNFLAMQGEKVMPLSFERPQDYRYQGPARDAFMKLNTPDGATDPAETAAGELDFLTRTSMDAQVSSDRIMKVTTAHKPGVQYPGGGFAEQLRTVAAMIKGGLPTRVYYVSLGGFDTHANQPGRHDQLMRNLATGVAAFLGDLKEQGNDERVLVMTFSEFGRRVAQNASQGTDHGTAAPMFFFGHHKHVSAGILGNHPSLTDLDRGDLKYNVDFRSCYAGVLQQWLDTDAQTCARILGAKFEAAPLIRA
jgi:uncharacterized protein (DUF1501 family)